MLFENDIEITKNTHKNNAYIVLCEEKYKELSEIDIQ